MKPTQEQLDFASKLTFMRDEADRLRLYKTAHRIHDAVREVGWEMAGQPMPKSERKQMYCNTPGVKE